MQKKTFTLFAHLLSIGGKLRDSISLSVFLWGSLGTLFGYMLAPTISTALRPLETRVTAVESVSQSTANRESAVEIRVTNLETDFKEFRSEQVRQGRVLDRLDERTLLIQKQK